MTSQRETRVSGAATTRSRLVLMAGLKLAGVLALDFVLLRLWGPDLVNMHSNLALVGALACLVAAIVATGWLALQLRADRSRWVRLDPRAKSLGAEWREE